MIILTRDERTKFAAYCTQESDTEAAMADQMEKLNGHDRMVKHLKIKGASFGVVAAELSKEYESMTVG